MASPVFKLCCSIRLLSSSLQSSDDEGLTTLSSGVVAGFVRNYASFNFVFLVLRRLSISLAHSCHLWNSAVKIEGVEGIHGFGSIILASSSLDAYPANRNVVKWVVLFLLFKTLLVEIPDPSLLPMRIAFQL